VAAQLAREGVAGFEAPLEGEGGFYRLYVDAQYDPAALLDDLGTRFYGEQLSFKPWPACRGTHAFIEMAGRLARDHQFDWRDIESIVAHTDTVHRMLCEPIARKAAPSVAIDAKFSIPFTIATQLVRGRVTLDDFGADSLADPDVRAIAGRVEPREQAGYKWRRGSGGGLTITLRDGARYHCEVHDALGCPERPLSEAQLVEKFVDCVGRAERPYGDAEARALADSILTSDRSDDIGALFD